MPFYDLYCPGCNQEHNIMATMADKTERKIPCPQCGSTGLETVYKAAPAYIKSSSPPPGSCASAGTCAAACPHARGH